MMTTTLVGLSGPAFGGSPKTHRKIVILLPTGSVPPGASERVGTFEDQLIRATSQTPLKLLHGPALQRQLTTPIRRVVARCGTNPGCLAKWGRKAHADRIVTCRATPKKKNGIKLTCLAVATKSAAVLARESIDLQNSTEVRPSLAQIFPPLLGEPWPGEQPDADGVSKAEALAALGDLDLTPAANTTAQGLNPSPALATLLAPDEAETNATVPSGRQPSETPLETAPTTGLSFSEPPWLIISGLTIASLGVALLGTGTYFGVQSKKEFDEGDTADVPQIRALRLEQDSIHHAERANRFFVVGGALAAIGSGLLVLDVLFLEPAGVAFSVAAEPTSARATFTW